MQKGSPTKLAEVLAAGRLGGLAREAARRRGETEQIRARLPADEAEHLVSTRPQGVPAYLVYRNEWAFASSWARTSDTTKVSVTSAASARSSTRGSTRSASPTSPWSVLS